MRSILQETFDVLELDPFYAALVPMHRDVFIQSVIFEAKGSVSSYASHFPSSYQHYAAKQLVDTRALNGFVVRKARELNASAPLNECATPALWLCFYIVAPV
jgi:ketopantoate reductase